MTRPVYVSFLFRLRALYNIFFFFFDILIILSR